MHSCRRWHCPLKLDTSQHHSNSQCGPFTFSLLSSTLRQIYKKKKIIIIQAHTHTHTHTNLHIRDRLKDGLWYFTLEHFIIFQFIWWAIFIRTSDFNFIKWAIKININNDCLMLSCSWFRENISRNLYLTGTLLFRMVTYTTKKSHSHRVTPLAATGSKSNQLFVFFGGTFSINKKIDQQ